MKNIRFTPLPTINELLKLYNVKALRKLSQNFLLEKHVTQKIVSAAGSLKDCEVCEIGPGPGSITRAIIMQEPKKVLGIEKDLRFEPILEGLENTSNGILKVIYADILNFDLSTAFDDSLRKKWEDEPPSIHIIGNLPFGISNVLLFQYLKDISLRRNAWSYGRVCLTLTFQKEVAERITSEILQKTRSRISVMCQNWCEVSLKLIIPGKAFLPKPDVDVGVVHFTPLIKPIIDLDFHMIEKIVKTTFNARQKFSMNTTSRLFPKELRGSLGPELFKLANVNPVTRPYQLSNDDWKRLCFSYKKICDRDPRLYSYNYRDPIKLRESNWKKVSEVQAI